MPPASTLHIFNGDCACNLWKKRRTRDPFLVWRENYLEGPLPPLSVPNPEFERIRAEFLHDCLPELSVERLLHFLLNLDDTVSALTAENTVVLWFDVCLFDQTILARILYLMRETKADIRLFCEDVALGDSPDIFQRDWHSFRRLDANFINQYAAAWSAIVGGAAAVDTFNSGKIATEPVLAEAMIRYAGDHPADGTAGISEKRLLQLVADGRHPRWQDIFNAFNAMEKHPFMGDTFCRRMLAELVRKGKISVVSDPLNGDCYVLSGGIPS